MLKRFLIFAGTDYCPGKAMDDFKEDVDTKEEAQHVAHCLRNESISIEYNAPARYDWVVIYDSLTKENYW